MEKVVKSNEEILSSLNVNKTQPKKDVYQVDPQFLTVEADHNVRNFDDVRVKEHVESLAANIAENGILTPLICRREQIGKDKKGELIYKYVIIDGECRFRAVNLLNEKERCVARIPVMLEREHNNDGDRILDMLNGNESLRFTPIELGYAYKKLQRLGWNDEKIAQRVGKSLNHVKECIALLGYDESVVEAVRENIVTANTVRLLDKKVKEEGTKDEYTRKKVVSERLQEAIKKVEEEEGETGKNGKLSVSKILGIKQTLEDRVISAIELIIDTVGEKRDFTRTNLTDLLEDLQSGMKIQPAINKTFSLPLLDEDDEAEAVNK